MRENYTHIDGWINVSERNRDMPPPMMDRGMEVIVSKALPIIPELMDDIVREVRHGLKKRCPAALRNFDAGPEPGPTHLLRTMGKMIISPELYEASR